MTDQKLNQMLHEAMGLCWHLVFTRPDKETAFICPTCVRCGIQYPKDNPDYCNDANLWTTDSELIKWIEEKGLIWDMLNKLIRITPHHYSLAWQYLTVDSRLKTIALLQALGKEII